MFSLLKILYKSFLNAYNKERAFIAFESSRDRFLHDN